MEGLNQVKINDIVIFDGYLVDVFIQKNDGSHSRGSSSRTRTDLGFGFKGTGSCEIFYVTRVEIDGRVFE